MTEETDMDRIRELTKFERKAISFAQTKVGVRIFEKRMIENFEAAIADAVEMYKEDLDNDAWYQQLMGG